MVEIKWNQHISKSKPCCKKYRKSWWTRMSPEFWDSQTNFALVIWKKIDRQMQSTLRTLPPKSQAFNSNLPFLYKGIWSFRKKGGSSLKNSKKTSCKVPYGTSLTKMAVLTTCRIREDPFSSRRDAQITAFRKRKWIWIDDVSTMTTWILTISRRTSTSGNCGHVPQKNIHNL